MRWRLPFEMMEVYMDFSMAEVWARELGFAKAGLCSTASFTEQKETVNHQPELRERRQLRFKPQNECPWATALLVLLWRYQQAPLAQNDDSLFIDSYYAASNQAYQAARRLEEKLINAGFKAEANVSYPAKAAAVRAGLGVIGHHGLLITPEYGSRVVIILLATDAFEPEKADETYAGECLHCGRCVKTCPTGAIDRFGMTHPERCLRNYMLEGIVVPEDKRALMERKLIGCDLCQRVCPMQRGEEAKEDNVFYLEDFLTMDETAFRQSVLRLGNVIGKNAARPQRVRAQAALLAGNRKREQDLAVLRGWEASDFDAVREHAKWAVKQIERHIQGIDQSGETR